MKIFLTADHGGFQLKEELKKILLGEDYSVEDLGPNQLNPDDDYPDFIFTLAERVVADPESLGLGACRSGSGEVIAANKVRGARATLSFSPAHAAKARTDDDANILILPADYIDLTEARKIVEAFLKTPFSSAERHLRRLGKITLYEKSH